MVVSRRAMLQGAAVVTSLIFLSESPNANATQLVSGRAGSAQAVAGLTTATAFCFDSAWSKALQVDFPVSYLIPKRSRGREVAISWDARLFKLNDTAYAVTSTSTVETTVVHAGEGRARVSLPSDCQQVILRPEVLNPYPSENLAAIQSTRAQLKDADGRLIEQVILEPQATACRPWGAEVSVSWLCVDGKIVPAYARIASIGPNDMPAGATLTLTAQGEHGQPVVRWSGPRAVEDADTTVAAVVRSTARSGMSDIVATTTAPVAPGREIELDFASSESNSEPDQFGKEIPHAIFAPPEKTAGMRMTGRHELFPVTASGNQASTYGPAPVV